MSFRLDIIAVTPALREELLGCSKKDRKRPFLKRERTYKFIHVTQAAKPISELEDDIFAHFRELYEIDDTHKLHYLQTKKFSDLDPRYKASDVLKPGATLYLVVDQPLIDQKRQRTFDINMSVDTSREHTKDCSFNLNRFFNECSTQRMSQKSDHNPMESLHLSPLDKLERTGEHSPKKLKANHHHSPHAKQQSPLELGNTDSVLAQSPSKEIIVLAHNAELAANEPVTSTPAADKMNKNDVLDSGLEQADDPQSNSNSADAGKQVVLAPPPILRFSTAAPSQNDVTAITQPAKHGRASVVRFSDEAKYDTLASPPTSVESESDSERPELMDDSQLQKPNHFKEADRKISTSNGTVLLPSVSVRPLHSGRFCIQKVSSSLETGNQESISIEKQDAAGAETPNNVNSRGTEPNEGIETEKPSEHIIPPAVQPMYKRASHKTQTPITSIKLTMKLLDGEPIFKQKTPSPSSESGDGEKVTDKPDVQSSKRPTFAEPKPKDEPMSENDSDDSAQLEKFSRERRVLGFPRSLSTANKPIPGSSRLHGPADKTCKIRLNLLKPEYGSSFPIATTPHFTREKTIAQHCEEIDVSQGKLIDDMEELKLRYASKYLPGNLSPTAASATKIPATKVSSATRSPRDFTILSDSEADESMSESEEEPRGRPAEKPEEIPEEESEEEFGEESEYEQEEESEDKSEKQLQDKSKTGSGTKSNKESKKELGNESEKKQGLKDDSDEEMQEQSNTNMDVDNTVDSPISGTVLSSTRTDPPALHDAPPVRLQHSAEKDIVPNAAATDSPPPEKLSEESSKPNHSEFILLQSLKKPARTESKKLLSGNPLRKSPSPPRVIPVGRTRNQGRSPSPVLDTAPATSPVGPVTPSTPEPQRKPAQPESQAKSIGQRKIAKDISNFSVFERMTAQGDPRAHLYKPATEQPLKAKSPPLENGSGKLPTETIPEPTAVPARLNPAAKQGPDQSPKKLKTTHSPAPAVQKPKARSEDEQNDESDSEDERPSIRRKSKLLPSKNHHSSGHAIIANSTSPQNGADSPRTLAKEGVRHVIDDEPIEQPRLTAPQRTSIGSSWGILSKLNGGKLNGLNSQSKSAAPIAPKPAPESTPLRKYKIGQQNKFGDVDEFSPDESDSDDSLSDSSSSDDDVRGVRKNVAGVLKTLARNN